MSLSEKQKFRLLEMIPGASVWLTFGAAVVFSWLSPLAVIAFIIVFDLYWLIRVLYGMTYIILAWRRFRKAIRVDWWEAVRRLPGWQQVYHLVVIPTATESLAVLDATIDSLSKVSYQHDRMIIVLAIEERQSRSNIGILEKKYSQSFRNFLVYVHPAGLTGEVAGKGANSAWAGRQAQRFIDQEKIPYRDIIVSTFDADSIAHPQYFAYLTKTWLEHPDRHHTSYQPIPLFHNNVWEAMAPMRVVANSTTFWMLGETMRPDKLLTFSSHSMPWTALVDVDFWQNDVVSEDSRIFLQCFLRYDGHYTVTPMYIPISMDTVSGRRWWQSWINQYKQIRRWAYGAENFPYMVWNFMRSPQLPLSKKIKYSWYQFEGGWSWATAPLLILLLGWLPFKTNPDAIATSALAHNAPAIIQIILSLTLVGVAVSALLSTILLPPRPVRAKGYIWMVMVLQWIFLPVTMIVFGSIPAIESQTRLMLGKYLGFWVTEKTRSKAI